MAEADDLLIKTSRTFGLAIPLLPEPTRTEVKIAYLLFRIIDTFEDATNWLPSRRATALDEFVALLDQAPGPGAAKLAAECQRHPPVDRDDYLELLSEIPYVLSEFQMLRPEARDHIRAHVARTAEGMGVFTARTNGSAVLQLQTREDLREYCYMVAGIVGEMLTELYLLGRPQLAALGPDLRQRAPHFGEGLQLVNILKDAGPDAAEGRVYLPPSMPLDQVFALAQSDLEIAAGYTDMLRVAGAENGLVAFNALIMRLAVATLDVLRRQGLGAKLTRLQVASIIAQVARGLDAGEPVSAEL
jgi:farnesyl-diphosphate farnesyltransferase